MENKTKWLYQIGNLKKSKHLLGKNFKKVYNPKTLKEIARENFKSNDKKLEKELAKKMINPYYFFDGKLKIGFKINLESHNINHANCIWTITLLYLDFGT